MVDEGPPENRRGTPGAWWWLGGWRAALGASILHKKCRFRHLLSIFGVPNWLPVHYMARVGPQCPWVSRLMLGEVHNTPLHRENTEMTTKMTL